MFSFKTNNPVFKNLTAFYIEFPAHLQHKVTTKKCELRYFKCNYGSICSGDGNSEAVAHDQKEEKDVRMRSGKGGYNGNAKSQKYKV